MRRMVLIGGIIALIGSLIGGALLSLGRGGAVPAPDALRDAEARWAQNAPAAYRSQVIETSAGGTCSQEILVRDADVAEVFGNGCGHPANWTVERLFNWIAQASGRSSGCFPSETVCACRVTVQLEAHFDQALGYPTTLAYEWQMTRNWSNVAYWREVAFNPASPDCERRGFGGEIRMQVAIRPEN